MKGLIIDTSSQNVLCVALDDNRVVVQDTVPAVNTSTSIIPVVDATLASLGIYAGDLTHIAAVAGPGSFTGLRIGVSVANAMGTLGCLMLPINVLDVLAHGQPQDTLCAVKARVGYCYTNRGEMTCDEVAQEVHSVGLAGSGAQCELARAQYIDTLVAYAQSHWQEASTTPIAPLYLKKCKAERLREGESE